jgi:predicted ATPase/DNA-binding CsgD family transcriptional regulator
VRIPVHGGQTGLIGRVVELADAVRLLEHGRVLTLTGIGGSGKTRIARRVIHETADRYPSGAWVVELADLTDPDLVADVIAGALDLRAPAGPDVRTALAAFLADHPGLLVLDNCEHLVNPVADLVAELLTAARGLTVLATSRLPLRILQETVYQVAPLSSPDEGVVVDLADADRYDAIALYAQRATEAMSSFRLNADNVASVGRLVARLEGVPLAIELAAARVRLLSPDSLLERISDRLDVLESDRRDRPVRQRSLAASVGWSYDLCSEQEQTLWKRLSVFSGGFELEAAEMVCSGDGVEVLDLLSTLVDMSVVSRVGEAGSRFRMLETIRQYGAERLDESAAPTGLRDRHLQWYADLVAKLEREWTGPDQQAWIRLMRAEHPNLRAALDHALRDPSTALVALRMCHGLEPLWICAGLLGEARRWIERSMVLTEGADADKVRGLRMCAWFGALQMDLDYARARVTEATTFLAEDADDLTRAHLYFADGAVSSWETDVARGIELLEASQAAFRRAGNLTGTVEALLNTGIAKVFAGDFDNAGLAHQRCLAMTDPVGETFVGAYARWSAGISALMSGEVGAAASLEHDALTRSSALGDQLAMALELETLAWIAAIEENAERAAVLLGGAGSIWRRISMPIERTPYICDLHVISEDQARALIDGETFARYFERGLRMPTPEVVALALATQDDPVADRAGPLTRRENEVAALVAEALSNRDIAERLFLSERTVEGHVQNILRKLGFSSRARIVAWYVASG